MPFFFFFSVGAFVNILSISVAEVWVTRVGRVNWGRYPAVIHMSRNSVVCLFVLIVNRFILKSPVIITFVVSFLILSKITFTSLVNSFIGDWPGDRYMLPIISFGWLVDFISMNRLSYRSWFLDEKDRSLRTV